MSGQKGKREGEGEGDAGRAGKEKAERCRNRVHPQPCAFPPPLWRACSRRCGVPPPPLTDREISICLLFFESLAVPVSISDSKKACLNACACRSY